MFKPYMHLEKYGNTEVESIELGKVYVFPKLDGTNASLWLDERGIGYGSRNRDLRDGDDNQGFKHEMQHDKAVAKFFEHHPNLRLYGEWLVPHTFKGYRADAWRKFYVFDVLNDATGHWLTYDAYKPLLDDAGLHYIPPIAEITNATYENLLRFLEQCLFLCPDGGEPGEGIVLKNYDYYNKFHRQVWAKIVRQEFKEANVKAFNHPSINNSKLNEQAIVDRAVTKALVDKTKAKIEADSAGWSSKYIPRLLETVFYDVVREELWDALKEIKFGAVNFTTLRALTIKRIKELVPELF